MKNIGLLKRITGHAVRLLALLLAVCLLPVMSMAEAEEGTGSDWIDFVLICNEGMNNDKGNAGNTIMLVAINRNTGRINLVSFTWDTFIDYDGYDVPQKLDMPYRNNGPQELIRVFNNNFDTGISRFLSLNYLNLASLIDSYDGVEVDISIAERNALNGMVASKRNQLQEMVGRGLLTQLLLDSLASDYYLNEYGPSTHLNGLQAVGFGWLQYDSVYNCCERDLKVVSALFHSVGTTISERVAFYTNQTGKPEDARGRRVINLDDLTDDDREFISRLLSPIFDMAYHNLSDEDIMTISVGLARTAYLASRQGVNVFDHVGTKILPLEAKDEYEIIAGAKGHVVDKDSNAAAIREFLHSEK